VSNAITAAARDCVGRPFAHQGRGDWMDCLGVVLRVAAAGGMSSVEVPTYGRAVRTADALRLCRRHLRQVDEITPGRVLVFSINGFAHFAVVTDHPSGVAGMVHASTQHGKVVEHVLTPAWRRRVAGVFALGAE